MYCFIANVITACMHVHITSVLTMYLLVMGTVDPWVLTCGRCLKMKDA